MSPRSRRWLLISSALACAWPSGCATDAQRDDEPARQARSDIGSAPKSGAEPDASASRQLLQRAREREQRRGERAWRCLVESACDALEGARAGAQQDLELAIEVLRQRVASEGERLAFRTAARLALEEAAAQSERARAALEAGSVLHFGAEMPYALADLASALSLADPEQRLGLLSSSTPLLDARQAIAAEAARAREEVAARTRRTSAELIALRAGLTEAELRTLVSDVLTRTAPLVTPLQNGPADVPALLAQHESELDATSWRRGPLVQAFGGRRAGRPSAVPQCVVVDPPEDVRLLEGVHNPPSLGRYARACAAAASRLPEGPWDPAWLHLVGTLFRDSAWLSASAAKSPAARARHRVAFVLEVRRLGVETLAALDNKAAAPRDELDALATTWAAPKGPTRPGASALLGLDATGASADSLVIALVAAAMDAALTARHGPGWAGDANASANVEAELEALAQVWLDGGPRGVLRALGITTLDATPVVSRAQRL